MMVNTGLMSMLDETIISKTLTAANRQLIDELMVCDLVGSTNDEVLNHLTNNNNGFVICVANQQSAGRGRKGRIWQSPANANIYLSVGFKLKSSQLSNISGLSLVSGVVLARFLQSLGLKPSLKWPNDLLIEEKKLAGILLESRIRGDEVYVVVGVGLNVKMPVEESLQIDQPWTDLQSALDMKSELPAKGVERNWIVSKMVEALMGGMVEYQSSGFASFMEDWKNFDLLTGRNVIVLVDEMEVYGKVAGLAEDFSLRVNVADEEKNFYAADIKLKL